MKKVVVSAIVASALAGILAVDANAFDLGDIGKGLDKVTKEVGKVQGGKSGGDKAFQNLVEECQNFFRKHKITLGSVWEADSIASKLQDCELQNKMNSAGCKQWQEEKEAYEKANAELAGKAYGDIDIKKYTSKKTLLNKHACGVIFRQQKKVDYDGWKKFRDEDY